MQALLPCLSPRSTTYGYVPGVQKPALRDSKAAAELPEEKVYGHVSGPQNLESGELRHIQSQWIRSDGKPRLLRDAVIRTGLLTRAVLDVFTLDRMEIEQPEF